MRRGDTKTVGRFLALGFNVNSRDARISKYRTTALHIAASAGNSEMVRFLIAHGANVNARTKSGAFTPLDWAVWRSSVGSDEEKKRRLGEVARTLFESGADPTLGSSNGWFAFLEAVERGCTDVLEMLLAAGVGNKNTRGAAVRAAALGYKDMLIMLLDHGVDVKDVVELFLSRGAKINALDDKGRNLLHLAAGAGDHKALELAIEYGLDVNGEDDEGQTPLHHVALSSHTTPMLNKVAGDLLGLGADPARTDSRGRTPLYYAGQQSHTHVLSVPEQYQADAEKNVVHEAQTSLNQ